MLAVLLMIRDEDERNKLEELYYTYNKELFYVAYQILRDYHDAQDVLQNAFIKVYKHLHKIGDIRCKKTRAYLVIIVRNLSFDRYNEKRKVVPTDFEAAGEDIQDLNTVSLDDYILHLELGRELAGYLAKLNSNYADVLTLKYYYGYNNAEIGEMFSMTTENVSLRLCRAKAALKRLLTEGGVAHE